MIIYADTSFLVSFFNQDDVNYRAACDLAGKLERQDFVICEVHQLELPAAVRAATHRQKGAMPEYVARRIINRFDRAMTRKSFQRKETPLADSIAMARSLGEAHGWKEKHTAFDLWHLAAAWSLSAAVFLTFDRRQAELARLLGMKT
ncbi:MAG: PIN domain-containing protein [Limisphaerales bacterium]